MGNVIQFPTSRRTQDAGAGPVTDLYPNRMYPMDVRKFPVRPGVSEYRPSPTVSWTSGEATRWMLGVIATETHIPIVLRATRVRDTYSLQIGTSPRQDGLFERQVWDQLAGVYCAVMALKADSDG